MIINLRIKIKGGSNQFDDLKEQYAKCSAVNKQLAVDNTELVSKVNKLTVSITNLNI